MTTASSLLANQFWLWEVIVQGMFDEYGCVVAGLLKHKKLPNNEQQLTKRISEKDLYMWHVWPILDCISYVHWQGISWLKLYYNIHE